VSVPRPEVQIKISEDGQVNNPFQKFFWSWWSNFSPFIDGILGTSFRRMLSLKSRQRIGVQDKLVEINIRAKNFKGFKIN